MKGVFSMIFDTEFSDFNLAKAQLYTIQAYFPRRELKIWKIWEYETEKDMVIDFVDWFLKVNDKILIGYNLLKTDIPLLMLKAQKIPQSEEFFLKINKCNIIDLHLILTFLNKGKIQGLEAWCKEFNIPYQPSLKGNEIKTCFETANFEAITDYISIESKTVSELYSKLYRRTKLKAPLEALK